MFAVCVTFELKNGVTSRFLPTMKRQAEQSLLLETDCHVFDICVGPGGETIFLYELYSDAQAFQAHLESAHFGEFDAEVAPMISSKTVRTYETVIRS